MTSEFGSRPVISRSIQIRFSSLILAIVFFYPEDISFLAVFLGQHQWYIHQLLPTKSIR
jgi:hypothetical protein